MAISLKALYDQVQGIKKSGFNVTEWNKSSSGYITFSNGLILNYGQVYNKNVTFAKAFPNTCIQVIVSPYTSGGITKFGDHWCVDSLTKTGLRLRSDQNNCGCRWLAIGYLVSNRIKGWVM